MQFQYLATDIAFLKNDLRKKIDNLKIKKQREILENFYEVIFKAIDNNSIIPGSNFQSSNIKT